MAATFLLLHHGHFLHGAGTTRLLLGGSKLKKLRFYLTYLTSVSPEVLVGAIQKLEEVVITHGTMTVEQITAVLTMVKEKQHGRLQRFGIGIDLGSVSPSLVEEASFNKILEFI